MWRWILVICSYLSEFGHHSVQVLGSFKHSDACISGWITCGKLIKNIVIPTNSSSLSCWTRTLSYTINFVKTIYSVGQLPFSVRVPLFLIIFFSITINDELSKNCSQINIPLRERIQILVGNLIMGNGPD